MDEKKVKKRREKINQIKEETVSNKKDISRGLRILEYHNLKKEDKRLENIEKAVSTNKKRVVKMKKDLKRSEREEEKLLKRENRVHISLKHVIIAIVVIIVVFLIYLFYTFSHIFGISFNKHKKFEDAIKLNVNLSENSKFIEYNKNLLIYSGKDIKAFNNSGNVVFEHKLEDQFIPKIYVKSKYLAIANEEKGTVYLFESNREILNKKVDGKINNVYLDDLGNFAVEYSKTGYKRILELYNKKGKHIYTVNIDGSGISDVILLESAKKMFIVQTDTSSLSVGVSIKYIDTTQKEVVIKEVAKIENALLQDVNVNNSSIIILLDRKIISLNTKNFELTTLVNLNEMHISHVSLSNSYYTVLGDTLTTEDDVVSRYKIEVYRYNNTKTFEGSVINIPKRVYTNGALIYMLYQDRIQINNKWGVEIRDINIDFSPKELVVFNNSKSYAIIYSNKVYLLNI